MSERRREPARDAPESLPGDVGGLLEEYRPRLRRMVDLRLDPRVRGRIDASDVLQEAFVEVVDRLPVYRETRGMPFFLWVRLITGQKIAQMHRHHLGAEKRDARREAGRGAASVPAASSPALAGVLAASGLTSPSRAAMREEELARVERALEELSETDREVLALRHFEQLTNVEVSHVLGTTEAAASIRYWRAVERLRGALPG